MIIIASSCYGNSKLLCKPNMGAIDKQNQYAIIRTYILTNKFSISVQGCTLPTQSTGRRGYFATAIEEKH